MRVAIRVDASLVRGTGHVMRCLCLADALRTRNVHVTFVTRDLADFLRQQIELQGHAVVALPDWSAGQAPDAGQPAEAGWTPGQQRADADAVAAALAGTAWDFLLVDHYALGSDWERAIRSLAPRLAVIDDLGRAHDCDVLLDQNFHLDPQARYAGKLPATAKALLGPSYALLRPAFRALRGRVRPRAGALGRILVFMGGMDAGNLTGQALRVLDQAGLAGIATDVVIGAGHPHRESLQQRCATRPATVCHVQTPDIAGLMADADLAIGAGGGANWERMALGVPTLALCVAENQRAVLDDCSRAGLVYLADAHDDASFALHLRALAGNPGLREHLSRQGMACVDGKGALRVAAVLAGDGDIQLRFADDGDADAILAWRNAPEVRASSRTDAPVAPDAHRAWFARVQADPRRHLLVGERNGQPVGVIRFDGDEACGYEISIYLVPGASGQGVGTALLEAAERWLRHNVPQARRIHAEVLAHNVASLQLFERCGYRRQSSTFSKDLLP